MIRTVVFLAFVSLHGHTLAQRSKSKWDAHPVITTTSGDSVLSFNVSDKKGQNLSSEKRYFWFNNGSVGSAQGGVTGRVLHGDFTVKSKRQGLIEKGKFEYGLKTGWWLRWHRNGSMKSKVFWKGGFKDGVFYSYSLEGNLKVKGYYKNNLLHGILYTYGEGDQVTQTRYYKGKLIPLKANQVEKTESEKKAKTKKGKTTSKIEEEKQPDLSEVVVVPEKKLEVINRDNKKKDQSKDSIAVVPVTKEPKKKGRIPLSERIKKKQ